MTTIGEEESTHRQEAWLGIIGSKEVWLSYHDTLAAFLTIGLYPGDIYVFWIRPPKRSPDHTPVGIASHLTH